VRATDYVRERLGLQEGQARWLAQLGRQLRRIPEFGPVLDSGLISPSHVIELGRLLTPDTPRSERLAWIARAAGTSVRVLRRQVRDPPAGRGARSAGRWRRAGGVGCRFRRRHASQCCGRRR
jgi:hypothetical protein